MRFICWRQRNVVVYYIHQNGEVWQEPEAKPRTNPGPRMIMSTLNFQSSFRRLWWPDKSSVIDGKWAFGYRSGDSDKSVLNMKLSCKKFWCSFLGLGNPLKWVWTVLNRPVLEVINTFEALNTFYQIPRCGYLLMTTSSRMITTALHMLHPDILNSMKTLDI